MKVCLIGTRGHHRYVFDGLSRMPETQIIGMTAGAAEDSLDALSACCDEYHQQPELFEDYRVMLDRQQPDIVVVSGPFELHARMCIEAFKRGIHVFCEKPVALDWEDFASLKDAYDAANIHFSAMMGLRYDPAFYTAWQTVQNGAVGTIRMLNTRKSYKLGARSAYYHHRATYGGTIPWVGSHAIDWIHWFSGERFESVHAHHSSLHNKQNAELEISALCQFVLSHDVLASASIDYLRPENAPSHGDDRLRVAGTDGVIEVRHGQVFLINQSTKEEERMPVDCDRQIFHDFVEGIKGRATHLISVDEIWAVTEACLLARQSADERKTLFFRRDV